MKDEFTKIRVVDRQDGSVDIHYDYDPAWFRLTTEEARELAIKIIGCLDYGIEFALSSKHGG